jgi:membrane-associated phospholipid phosphatase
MSEVTVAISRRPAGWMGAFAGLAAVAGQPPGSWLRRLDASLAEVVANSRSASTVRVARAISALAEPAPAAAGLAAAAAVATRRVGWQAACTPFLTVAAGLMVRRKLSDLIARERPPAVFWLAEPEGFSLPSRHTALAALTAGACASAVGAGPGTSQVAALLAAAGAGASRVTLGVHWPSDVLAGWLFAAGWLDLCRWLEPAALAPEFGRGRRPGSGNTERHARSASGA